MRAPAIVASPSPALSAVPGSLGSPGPSTSGGIALERNTGTQNSIGQSQGNGAGTQTAIDQLLGNRGATAIAATAGPVDQSGEDGADTIEAALDWQAFVPTDTADHLATMDRAARDSGCGVPWHLLAAIARVESDFGRNMATSSAGALGYGQFLPSSWQSFGNDGNVYDYRDALPAIATYLCQSGLERDPRAALFAYNHADWYVDLVLNLAVRYDRMAPGAPTPDVLDTGPATEPGVPLHYAAGRDVRQQSRARTVNSQASNGQASNGQASNGQASNGQASNGQAPNGQADWLGVPWRGRSPGASMSPETLESTTLTMVRASFGLKSDLPAPTGDAPQSLSAYADRAWDAGLLPAPIQPPVLLPSPDDLRPAQDAQWSIGEIRRTIERGQPVVALVDARLLPGHSPKESGDQPIVLIGKTPTGLVYSDPSFSSSLGYGLELGDAEFVAAWQAAATPRQALAFSLRPRPLARDAHLRMAEPPPVYARVLPTPAPPTPQPTVAPTQQPTRAAPVETNPDETAPKAAANTPAANEAGAAIDDPSWVIVLAAAAMLAAAIVVRRVRARRSV